jgi:hypothetical protein
MFTKMYFVYLSNYDTFNDAANRSSYTALNAGMINKQRTGKMWKKAAVM